MAENEPILSEAQLDRFLASLRAGEVAPSANLQARVMKDFDNAWAERGLGPFSRLSRAIWPEVPIWQPAAALVASLSLGLAVGYVLPSMLLNQSGDTAFAFEVPGYFDLAEGS
ncbi:MAG: hypothetical protein GC166_00115 [Alphaproteobacteria bacterium]|nr:hypothetical protein [Alphaproteobacteria bacterium]